MEVNLDVKVWGLDRQGKLFVQNARTLDATRLGARLIGVDCVREGEIIGLQHGVNKARFKVVWTGRENTPKAGQIGIHCMESEKPVFISEPAAPFTVPAPPRITRPQLGFEETKRLRPSRRDMPASRRRHPRYPCSGGVELRQQDGGPPAWGNLSDVSLTGCYVETASTFSEGSMVSLHIRTHDLNIRGRAMVKASHHAVGMGLAFLHLGAEDQQNLEFLMGTLAGRQEMLPENQRTFVPADAPAPPQPMPLPAVAPAASRPATGSTSPQKSVAIATQIMTAIAQLTELEQNLVKDKVDPRLIAQFHDAMEHTRQTAWTVQQWVDLHAGSGDPFEVLPQLEAERMHMLIKLSRNVIADIDSTSINEFTEGIGELNDMMQQLHKRLARLFGKRTADEDDGPARFGSRK
ncbi:MAG TPA: PilZ domain-containing protein [Candidatus Saccharimonadales bacterium]|nr:PilZ domain-containing protein [Candidatus Saccharimonadales bacterium]